jgi:hypothetical protein
MGMHSARQAYHEPRKATVPMTHLMPGQHKQTVSMAATSPSILFSRGHSLRT